VATALCALWARPSGYFNYDKIFERGTTRLWVILIMARKNYRKASLWAENCPNFFFFLFGPAGKTEVFQGKFFQGKFFQGNEKHPLLAWVNLNYTRPTLG
jgi:hypothetical protein